MRSYAILAIAASAAAPAFVSAYPVRYIVGREATTQTNVGQHGGAPYPDIHGHATGEQAAHTGAQPQVFNAEHPHQLAHEPAEHNAVYPNHGTEHTALPNRPQGEHAEKYGEHAGKHSHRQGGRKNHRQNGRGRQANRQGAYPHTTGSERTYAHQGEHAALHAAHEAPYSTTAEQAHAQPELHQHAARGRIEKASGLLNHVTNVAYAVQGVHDAWEDLKQHHKRSPMPMPKGEKAHGKVHRVGKGVGLVGDIANAASSVQGAWQSVHNRRDDAYESLYEREFELDDLE
ncbi:hypothetical protein FOMPIDRAFT_1022576 [Fomitopsis schrenkii]|uniref:Uncharacterized protein n=1 Tax=Fomitopsis schrenkii TaxID=2126942 RepID=S8EED9_FOMSC|nr:hypothetical protein FOMPIDRAFT_1022576 [Fomitopsis schrenkii]